MPKYDFDKVAKQLYYMYTCCIIFPIVTTIVGTWQTNVCQLFEKH